MLVALADYLELQGEEPLGDLGLEGHDYAVLAILAVDGPETQNDIARLMHRAPTVVVAAIDKLERKGFVARQRDPADRRRSRVTPTQAGLSALAAADRLGRQIVTDTFWRLSEAEIATLHDLLNRGLGLEGTADRP